MLFNLIYSEGNSCYYGSNSFDEKIRHVVENEGLYYEFRESQNYNGSYYLAESVECPTEISMDYDYHDENHHKWSKSGGKIELDLKKFLILDGNEFLLNLKKEEIRIHREKFLENKKFESENFSIDYLKSLGLDETDLSIAECWRNKVLQELISNNNCINDYRAIFEKMADIINRKAIVVCHKKAYYDSPPQDYIVGNLEVFFDIESKLIEPDSFNEISFEVFKISKSVEIGFGNFYIGSYYTDSGYVVDVYWNSKFFSIKSNISVHKGNSLKWERSLDNSLKTPRFFIEDPAKDIFEIDNISAKESKSIRRKYYLEQMNAAQLAFGLNFYDAKSLLEEVGSVKNLALLIDLKLLYLRQEELEILANKKSNKALDKFFSCRLLEKPYAKLANITKMADFLLAM